MCVGGWRAATREDSTGERAQARMGPIHPPPPCPPTRPRSNHVRPPTHDATSFKPCSHGSGATGGHRRQQPPAAGAWREGARARAGVAMQSGARPSLAHAARRWPAHRPQGAVRSGPCRQAQDIPGRPHNFCAPPRRLLTKNCVVSVARLTLFSLARPAAALFLPYPHPPTRTAPARGVFFSGFASAHLLEDPHSARSARAGH